MSADATAVFPPPAAARADPLAPWIASARLHKAAFRVARACTCAYVATALSVVALLLAGTRVECAGCAHVTCDGVTTVLAASVTRQVESVLCAIGVAFTAAAWLRGVHIARRVHTADYWTPGQLLHYTQTLIAGATKGCAVAAVFLVVWTSTPLERVPLDPGNLFKWAEAGPLCMTRSTRLYAAHVGDVAFDRCGVWDGVPGWVFGVALCSGVLSVATWTAGAVFARRSAAVARVLLEARWWRASRHAHRRMTAVRMSRVLKVCARDVCWVGRRKLVCACIRLTVCMRVWANWG